MSIVACRGVRTRGMSGRTRRRQRMTGVRVCSELAVGRRRTVEGGVCSRVSLLIRGSVDARESGAARGSCERPEPEGRIELEATSPRPAELQPSDDGPAPVRARRSSRRSAPSGTGRTRQRPQPARAR